MRVQPGMVWRHALWIMQFGAFYFFQQHRGHERLTSL
jgi:hypothetical protein